MARGVLSIASVLVFAFLACASELGGDLCRDGAAQGGCVAPVAGGEEDCAWCDLSQRYNAAARGQEFRDASYSSSSTRSGPQSRRLLESNECLSIPTKGLCSRIDYCRWCRSEALDDSCFSAAEAARLPRTIFLCSDVA
jgi:hypothetical protein